eukprot:m.75436 g.75436  ORF g.75436 m.75436 type:complete len:1104 (-) comp12500_c0_seq3:1732-5043(-)
MDVATRIISQILNHMTKYIQLLSRDPSAVVHDVVIASQDNPGIILLFIFVIIILSKLLSSTQGKTQETSKPHLVDNKEQPKRIRKRDRIKKLFKTLVGAKSSNKQRIRKRDRLRRFTKEVLDTSLQKASSLFALEPVQEPVHPKHIPEILLQGAANQHGLTVSRRAALISSCFKSFLGGGLVSDRVLDEFYKHAETIQLKAGDTLFKVGDKDDQVFVVKEGSLVLKGPHGHLMATRKPGDYLGSLLSLMDVITGGDSKVKTLQAQAGEAGAEVFSLNIALFNSYLQNDTTLRNELAGIMASRLQRVTFQALSGYLGLPSKLILNGEPGLKETAGSIDPTSVKQALNLASKALGCDDGCISGSFLEVIPAGKVIISTDQIANSQDLFYLIKGELIEFATANMLESDDGCIVKPGNFVGIVGVLGNGSTVGPVKSKKESTLLRIPSAEIRTIMRKNKNVVCTLVQLMLQSLSPLSRRLDFAIESRHIDAGSELYSQGSNSNSLYIVVSGRLRSVTTRNGRKTISQEFGKSDIVGDMEAMAGTPRPASVHAVRDSVLIEIPATVLNTLHEVYPKILMHLVRNIALRNTQPDEALVEVDIGKASRNENFSTVALIAASDDVPLTEFAKQLAKKLSSYANVCHFNSHTVTSLSGVPANGPFLSGHALELATWLGEREESHRLVLYEADYEATPWTRKCIRQADCVLVVGKGDGPPTIGTVEAQLDALSSRAQKELVLLHDVKTMMPSGTAKWLNIRSWCNRHHHVRFEEPPRDHEPHQDIGRLARRLLGLSVGVVFGGGGAKGAAHIGIVRAMEEANIPIDIVGGVSIGAMVAGLYAQECGFKRTNFHERFRQLSSDMDRKLPFVLDLTYPATAMLTGAAFNRIVERALGNTPMEDLWLPCFCISTDVTAVQERVHQDGSLWRYVRASMSLSGFLPPLCDPHDGHWLLDGGYVNNMPVSIMKKMGAHRIYGIDIEGRFQNGNMPNFGDSVSGWWLLFSRLNPFGKRGASLPDAADIQSRLAYMANEVRKNGHERKGAIMFAPPIQRYKVLDWHHFNKIEEIGYTYGGSRIRQLRSVNGESLLTHPTSPKERIPRSLSLADMREFVEED